MISLNTPASKPGEGGTPDQLKPKVTRSAQIFTGGGEGVTPDQLKAKCQDLPNF